MYWTIKPQYQTKPLSYLMSLFSAASYYSASKDDRRNIESDGGHESPARGKLIDRDCPLVVGCNIAHKSQRDFATVEYCNTLNTTA